MMEKETRGELLSDNIIEKFKQEYKQPNEIHLLERVVLDQVLVKE
jgi:hypothetical protein